MDKSNFAYQGIDPMMMHGMNGGASVPPPPSYSAAINGPGTQGKGGFGVPGGRALSGGVGGGTSPPSAFYVKKWILMVTMFINMLGLLFALFCVDYIVEVVAERSAAAGTYPSSSEEEMKSTLKSVTYVLLVGCIALEGLFFYGVANQHLGLVTGYTVLSMLGAFTMLLGCVVNPAKILDTLVIVFIAGVAYSYMKDLRTMRDNRIRMGLDVI